MKKNTKYCLPHSGYHVLLKCTFLTGVEQHFIYLFYQGVYTARGDYPCLLAGDPVMRKGSLYDMLSPAVHLVKKERNILFGWRNIIFARRNLHILSLYFVYAPNISYSFEP